jgi:tetratricopeptide (TPR) repeat protein
MSDYIQYFNVEKMGRFPNAADALLTKQMGVFTKLASVQQARGSTIFVITGLGKPKRYYLWESFTIEDVHFDGEQYTVSGPGWVLLPPQVLQGKDFDKFKAACANFVSFRCIDDLPYRQTLRKIADKFHLPEVNAECEAFCDGLIQVLPKNGDAFYYRGTIRRRLGKLDAAREDFKKAVQLGTNFPQEAQAGMEATSASEAAGPASPAAGKAGKERLAGQVVSRGLFSQETAKKPAGVSDVAWRSVLQRRGQESFRQKLLQAYGGRCAVTGCDGEATLEAALIAGDGTGPEEVSNALLLRADVRTLFDLGLLRIHPRTRKVFLAESLKKGSYARLMARQLRLPEKAEDRPKREALEERWVATARAGG